MAARSADRHEQYTAAAMRRLVDAYESGEMSLETYRERRRRLLEAIVLGGPVPQPEPPSARPDAPRAIAWWPAAALSLVIVVILAIMWWLRR